MSIVWIMSLAILMAMVTIMNFTKKTPQNMKEKWSQFECGFNLMTPPHTSFSFQFFLVGILFLIFDVEIALVLSYPLEPKSQKSMKVLACFVMILAIGLLYEWQKGKIDWSKWMGPKSLQDSSFNPTI